MIAIIKEIIRLNNDPLAEDDDVDHLGNRRVRAVEIFNERFRVGVMRMRRTIRIEWQLQSKNFNTSSISKSSAIGNDFEGIFQCFSALSVYGTNEYAFRIRA